MIKVISKYIRAVLSVIVAEGLLFFFRPDKIYLILLILPIIYSSLNYGVWPSVFAIVVGAAAYSYFFIPPLYSLYVDDLSDAITLVSFLGVALTINHLLSKIRGANDELTKRTRVAETLSSFISSMRDQSDAKAAAA